MPMFIYHYMILNIIVNVPARGGADGFFPYYIGDTGSAGQGEPEVFFVFKKPFALRLRLISGGLEASSRGFFLKTGKNPDAPIVLHMESCAGIRPGEKAGESGGSEDKKRPNLYECVSEI